MHRVALGVFALCLALVLLCSAWMASGSRSIRKLPLLIGVAGLAFGLLLVVLNSWLPFAGGGDDVDYYASSQRVLISARDWFELGQFNQEQSGYPLLLTWASQLIGSSLIGLKLINLSAFLLTAIIWFRIGKVMQGKRLAYAMTVGILVATPFWIYWAFLLKDMMIVLLQSWFLLGMVELATEREGTEKWVHVTLSTLLLIPFRVQLMVVNSAVLILSLLLSRRRTVGRTAIYWALGAAVVVLVLHLGTDQTTLRALGAHGQSRNVDYETIRSTTDAYISHRERFAGFGGATRFVIVFLLGETAGFHVGLVQDKAAMLRGISVVPWILIGLPLFLIGSWEIITMSLTRSQRSIVTARTHISRGRDGMSRTLFERGTTYDLLSPSQAGWLPLTLFVLIYAFVAWVVSDTTRWRMPAYAVMVAIASYGWLCLRGRQRAWLLATWACIITLGAAAYYSLAA